jgi:hypothetical protein
MWILYDLAQHESWRGGPVAQAGHAEWRLVAIRRPTTAR